MSLAFSEKTEKDFQGLLAKYETRRSALLPTLYMAQEEFGYLSKEAQTYVAERLEIPPAYVFEAVSFYIMFKQKDMGKHCIQVCENVTCFMMGASAVLAEAKRGLGLEPEGVTQDKEFSLKVVQCIGACDQAPAIQVNETFLHRMDAEKMGSVLTKLREGAAVETLPEASRG